MKRVIQNERGMALALAIVALVVVGALIAGAFFAGTQEQRVGENARYSQRSFGVAEGAANYIIGHWNPRSEEHTSELQSQSNLVCRLLLEKKKKRIHNSL